MGHRTADVVVIGAGIIGCATAYYLAKAGRQVTLVERTGIAREASGSNLGGIANMNREPGTALFDLIAESTRLYPTLDEDLGFATEYRQCGSIKIYLTPEAFEEGQRLVTRQQAAGLRTRIVSPEEAREIEPMIPPQKIVGAAFCSTDGIANPPRLTAAFASAAMRKGATLLCPAEVTGIEREQGAVSAVQTTQGKILTRTVVNAAGAWSSQIGKMVDVNIPVTPCRGQVMVTEKLPHVVKRQIMGVEPWPTPTWPGTLLLGSTTEFVGFDKSTDYKTILEFARDLSTLFPFLRNVHIIRTYAGIRPATKDNVPFIGGVKDVDGFILACGHFRNGVGSGPATGKVVAELLTGQPTCISLAQCDLERPSAWA
jgi:glycine/D-amino acid oxidase-like deaminating enzyme